MTHVVSCHFNLQAYHAARYNAFLRQAGPDTSLTALLLHATADYNLVEQRMRAGDAFEVMWPQHGGLDPTTLLRRLDALRPDLLLFLGGYSTRVLRQIIKHGRERHLPLVLCTESKRDDAPRRLHREWVKSRIVAQFDAFLAGGPAHRDYLVELGAPRDAVFLGYDVVDNDFFASGAARVRAGEGPRLAALTARDGYFLASNRFIARKNLERLVLAYAEYRRRVERPRDLVLLGDGPERSRLEHTIRERAVAGVHLPGFARHEDLPDYYGRAGCFVHAATVEQWGLVINEAAASGLPILASATAGATAELVHEGVNGFRFDPSCVQRIAEALCRFEALDEREREDMGRASARIAARFNPEIFARGLTDAISAARARARSRRARLGRLDRLLLSL